MLSFLTRKRLQINSKRNNIQRKAIKTTQIRKKIHTSFTKQKQTQTKRDFHFYAPILPFRKKSLQKSSPTTPLPAILETTFPKRKCICSQTHLRFLPNVKEFFLKRFGVLGQTLRYFGVKFSFSGQFPHIFFSRFIRIPVFRQEAPPLQAF